MAILTGMLKSWLDFLTTVFVWEITGLFRT